MRNVIAILSLGAVCGAWVLFQAWIARIDRDAPGIRRPCVPCDGACGHDRLDEAGPRDVR